MMIRCMGPAGRFDVFMESNWCGTEFRDRLDGYEVLPATDGYVTVRFYSGSPDGDEGIIIRASEDEFRNIIKALIDGGSA